MDMPDQQMRLVSEDRRLEFLKLADRLIPMSVGLLYVFGAERNPGQEELRQKRLTP